MRVMEAGEGPGPSALQKVSQTGREGRRSGKASKRSDFIDPLPALTQDTVKGHRLQDAGCQAEVCREMPWAREDGLEYGLGPSRKFPGALTGPGTLNSICIGGRKWGKGKGSEWREEHQRRPEAEARHFRNSRVRTSGESGLLGRLGQISSGGRNVFEQRSALVTVRGAWRGDLRAVGAGFRSISTPEDGHPRL